MPNIASVFKDEISRIARKEVRRETAGLKKANSTYRAEIAALKRRAQALEKALRQALRRRVAASPGTGRGSGDDDGGPGRGLRFRPKGLAKLRERLGLSARECGLLLGVSGQSIYLWESGRARPSGKSLEGIAALRKLGKREAAARLEGMVG
jgi:DNA-binding XRE family transcriptional regulator